MDKASKRRKSSPGKFVFHLLRSVSWSQKARCGFEQANSEADLVYKPSQSVSNECA